jgi:hypothetical protein
MNADKFFEQYTIEEINKRTRISPISLRYIKNREYKKIQRVKFIGFVKIIEKEFKVDLSELIEEYNQATGNIQTEEPTKKSVSSYPKKHNTLFLTVLAIILFSLGAYLLYNTYNSKSKKTDINKTAYIIEDNNTNLTAPNTEENNTTTLNKSDNNITNKNNQNIQTENQIPQTQNHPKQNIPQNIKIIPNEKVWFRAINLDNNKTVEYLTSNSKTLNGSDWYIKFGHGNITIQYGDQNITPNTKKIVRILFKNGKYEYLKKPNRYEK